MGVSMSAYEFIAVGEPTGQADQSALVLHDLVSSLLSEHRHQKQLIERVGGLMAGSGHDEVLRYFFAGADKDLALKARACSNLFQVEPALKALDAEFWNRALALTKVKDLMPSNRQKEWDQQIEGQTCLPFEEAAVRDTLASLVASCAVFLNERVDAVFHALSDDHVTNSPAGFTKRMILQHARYRDVGGVNAEVARFITDLRFVIAVLMGRDTLTDRVASRAMTHANSHPGVWHSLDGGALRVRFHLVGTAHLEVHPDMAAQLNEILANIYPKAIPAKFRTRPQNHKLKDWPLIEKPLSFGALTLLTQLETNSLHPNEWWLGSSAFDRSHLPEAEMIIEAIGGAKLFEGNYGFEYKGVKDVINKVVTLGRIPEQVTHQFYATQQRLGLIVKAAADVQPGESVCEPSAGQGGLAKHLPREQVTCVEISPLNAAILEKHGFHQVVCADFLVWADTAPKFDVLVMNPPFAQGRAKAHLLAAASLVASKGRLVAILPASMKGNDLLPGWDLDWSQIYSDEFKGTSISVVVLAARRIVEKT